MANKICNYLESNIDDINLLLYHWYDYYIWREGNFGINGALQKEPFVDNCNIIGARSDWDL